MTDQTESESESVEPTAEQIEDVHRYRKEDGTSDWSKVEFDFINSKMNMREFAEKYYLPYPAMMNKAAAGQWTLRKKQIALEIEQIAQAKINTDRAEELAEFNRADLAMAKSIRGLVAARVNKIRKMVEKARAAGDDTLDAEVNPNELRTLSSTVESTQRIGRLALGVATSSAELTGAGGTPLNPNGRAPIIIIGGPPEEGEPMSLDQLEEELGLKPDGTVD